MGKLVTYLSILIFVDLCFLLTGQVDLESDLSIVTGAILNPSLIKTSVFFLLFLGIAGIAGLIATTGVTTGIFANATNVLAFTAMAVGMIGLLGDFLTIYNTLRVYNEVLAIIIIAPLLMIFIATIAEWLRVKD